MTVFDFKNARTSTFEAKLNPVHPSHPANPNEPVIRNGLPTSVSNIELSPSCFRRKLKTLRSKLNPVLSSSGPGLDLESSSGRSRSWSCKNGLARITSRFIAPSFNGFIKIAILLLVPTSVRMIIAVYLLLKSLRYVSHDVSSQCCLAE